MQPDVSTAGSLVYLENVFDSGPSVGLRNTNAVNDEVVSCGTEVLF